MKSWTEMKRQVKPSQKPKSKMTWLATSGTARGSFTGPINPLIAEYVRPDNTQQPQPEKKDALTPFYVPMVAKGTMEGGKPIHAAEIKTRGEFVNEAFGRGEFHKGGLASVYKFYLYAWLCLAATIILALFVNVYAAAIPAFLAGTFWSEKEVSVAWDIQWLKGKTLVHPA